MNWRTGDTVAALPIVGGYAEYLCLPSEQLVPVPYGLDPAEVVSVILNYTTAYQMLHRSAHIESGESVLVHSGGGGVGTALLQLGKLQGPEMYYTCSLRKQKIVSELGGIPIDYKSVDFVQEIFRLTNDGVDVDTMDYWMISTSGDTNQKSSLGGGLMKRKDPQQPNLNYIGVPSIDEYSNKVKDLGGKVVMPKTKVEGHGSFAVCTDTETNSFALWEIAQQK